MGFNLLPEEVAETLAHISSRRRYIEDKLIGQSNFVAEMTSRVNDLANYVQFLSEVNDPEARRAIAEAAIEQMQWESQLDGMPICLCNAFAAVVAVGRDVDLSEPDGVRDVYHALLQAIDINAEFREHNPLVREEFEVEIARILKEQY